MSRPPWRREAFSFSRRSRRGASQTQLIGSALRATRESNYGRCLERAAKFKIAGYRSQFTYAAIHKPARALQISEKASDPVTNGLLSSGRNLRSTR